MSKLTNEWLEAEIKSNDGMESIKLMAKELLELRKLRDYVGDAFDKKAALNAAHNFAPRLSDDPIANYLHGASGQHQQSHLAYAALMKDAESLFEVLLQTMNYLHWREDDLIGDDLIGDGKLTERYKKRVDSILKALIAWREKYGEKK